MCRLFGTLSTTRVDALAEIYQAPQSLLRQSHMDPKRLQSDGWGAGWYEGKSARLVKSAEPMYRDRKRLLRTASRIKTHCLVGHVRWASNPLKLPKHELLGVAHSQPFRYKSWIFAHNGTLYIPREVRAELGSWARLVLGRNDSEVLFYWLMKHLESALRSKNPSLPRIGKAVKEAFRGLDRIWAGCRNKYPIYKYGYHGVNWILTNGETLIALCYVDPQGFDKAKALASKQPYYQLNLQYSSEMVTIASEPLDKEGHWQTVQHGELLMAKVMPHGIKLDRIQLLGRRKWGNKWF